MSAVSPIGPYHGSHPRLILRPCTQERVDRRGFTRRVGFERGYITAEVHHVWAPKCSAGGSGLITAVSKNVYRSWWESGDGMGCDRPGVGATVHAI